jgi:predicted CopG family antitoxin
LSYCFYVFNNLNVDSMKLKHIVIGVDNYHWLKTLGQASESFNDVISKLRQEREAGENNVIVTATTKS